MLSAGGWAAVVDDVDDVDSVAALVVEENPRNDSGKHDLELGDRGRWSRSASLIGGVGYMALQLAEQVIYYKLLPSQEI
jgi:hypothetical protein